MKVARQFTGGFACAMDSTVPEEHPPAGVRGRFARVCTGCVGTGLCPVQAGRSPLDPLVLFFRRLAGLPLQDGERLASLAPAFYDEQAPRPKLAAWLERYAARVREEGIAAAKREERMRRVNPKYVFRNYLAQQAIDALEAGDAGPLERLMRVLEHPYDEQPEHQALAARRPEWARHRAGCSALSCSS